MSRCYGYEKSSLSGDEPIYEATRVIHYNKYDLRSKLDPIRDQGSIPKCVSVATTDMITFKMNIGKLQSENFKDDLFFKNRKDKSIDGMQPIDALDQFVRTGVGKVKGKLYARVNSAMQARFAITANGPLMICLPVLSTSDRFWIGNDLQGGHAVLLVGYDNNGFILRNSWGLEYGNNGYTYFPESDFNKIYECWTLIS